MAGDDIERGVGDYIGKERDVVGGADLPQHVHELVLEEYALGGGVGVAEGAAEGGEGEGVVGFTQVVEGADTAGKGLGGVAEGVAVGVGGHGGWGVEIMFFLFFDFNKGGVRLGLAIIYCR